MKNVTSWIFVLLALLFICIGKGLDYVVSCVFVLVALWLRLGGLWESLQETLAFHKWAHKDAMGHVNVLQEVYAPPKGTPTLWLNAGDPRLRGDGTLCKEGDIWHLPEGHYVLFKDKWEKINPTDAAAHLADAVSFQS